MNSAFWLLLIVIHAAQIVGAVCLVWLIARVFRKHSRVVWCLWLVVLIKCVTPPVVGSSWSVFSMIRGPWMSRTVETEPAMGLEEVDPTTVVVSDTPGTQTDAAASFGQVISVTSEQKTYRLVESGGTPSETSATDLAFLILCTSIALSFLWTLGRYIQCRRLIMRHRCPELEPAATQMISELAEQLNLRRPPRVIVSEVSFGPAVLGILQPIVLLPKVLLSDSELGAVSLRPILAHELAHISRGDTWTGLLQATCGCLWWFHPSVRLVNRWMKRAAEKCCDELVVCELNISPADYARCLLNVIECRQKLKPVPVFPGMTPMEITSQRMERIMTLTKGNRTRDLRTAAVAATVLGALILPGAVSAVPQDEQPRVAEERTAADDGQAATLKPFPAAVEGSLEYQTFPLEPVLKLAVTYGTVSHEEALEFLHNVATAELVRLASEYEDDENGKVQQYRIERTGDVLKVWGNGRHFNAVRRCLNSIRIIDPRPINHRVRLVTGPLAQKLLAELSDEQTGAITSAPQTNRNEQLTESPSEPPSTRHVRPTVRVVDVSTVEDLFLKLEDTNGLANVIAFPTTAVFSGSTGIVKDRALHPVIQEYIADKPKLLIMPGGIRAQLSPTRVGKMTVELDCRIENRELDYTNAIRTSIPSPRGTLTLQMPSVNVQSVTSKMRVSMNQCIVIGGFTQMSLASENDHQTSLKAEPMVVLVSVGLDENPEDDVEAFSEQFFTESYRVADLVAPIPNTLSEESPRKPAKPDLTQLAELIRATIGRDFWKDNSRARMHFNEKNLSLVVRAKPQIHEKIADLMVTLRKMQERQNTVEILCYYVTEPIEELAYLDLGILEMHKGGGRSFGILNQFEAAVVKQLARGRESRILATKATLFDEQEGVITSSMRESKVQLKLRTDQQQEANLIRVDFELQGADADQKVGRLELNALIPAGGALLHRFDAAKILPKAGIPEGATAFLFLRVTPIDASEEVSGVVPASYLKK